MNRLQIVAVMALAALQGCSAADEPLERRPDAGKDAKTAGRADVQGADRLDASGGSDADDASMPPEPDGETPDTWMPPADTAIPPVDGPIPPPVDAMPPPVDATPPNDALPPTDIAADVTVPSCLVTFTVSGVRWDAPEGGTDAQVSGRAVRLVGDAANIGSWSPNAGVLLSETSSGTWSGTATFRDGQLVEFKFVKLVGTTPEWETWVPYDSNRSMRVECFGDAGAVDAHGDVTTIDGSADRTNMSDVTADVAADSAGGGSDAVADGAGLDADGATPDAGADAPNGDSGDGGIVPVPARGRSYKGEFGVRPPDATK